MPTHHLKITGKVQGVFYRVNARRMANQLSLTGWIKNEPDGSVEAIVTGDTIQLSRFEEWCRQGPENAKVTSVTIQIIPDICFKDFQIS